METGRIHACAPEDSIANSFKKSTNEPFSKKDKAIRIDFLDTEYCSNIFACFNKIEERDTDIFILYHVKKDEDKMNRCSQMGLVLY